MPRFAANLSWLFPELPFLDRFEAARAAGFGAVEYLFPYDVPADAIAARLARHRLTPVLFNLPPGDLAAGERGLAALPGRRADFAAALELALTYAQATDCRRLHVMAGVAQGDAALAAYRDALALACDRAGTHGIDILIEPLNPKDAPGYLLNSFALAQDVIAQVARPNLKLQFDIYHCRMLGGDAAAELARLLPLIGHVQVAGAPARAEPGAEEIAALHTLDRLGYDGFVGCEYRPAGDTVAGLSWMRGF